MAPGFDRAVVVAVVVVTTCGIARDVARLLVAVAMWIAVSVVCAHLDRRRRQRRRRHSGIPAFRASETSTPPPPPPPTVDTRLERDSAFGRLPRALVLTLWTHLDRRSHAAFSRTARWTARAVAENPRRVSPLALSVRSVSGAACATAMRRYHPCRLECSARDNSFGGWLAAYSATLTDLTLRVSTTAAIATVTLASLVSLTALTALTLEYRSAAATDAADDATAAAVAAPTLQAEIAHISALTRLRRLRIDGEVESLEPLRRLVHLTELRVGPESVDIRALADLPLLAVVRLVVSKPHGGDDVAYLRPLEACAATLTALDLSGSFNLDDCDGVLAPFVGLRDLDLSRSEIATLDSVRGMRRLERLACDGYSGQTLEPLRDLTALKHLSVSHAQILEDVRALSTLVQIETLAMVDCPALRSLAPLAHLTALVFLDLENSDRYSGIAPLGRVTTLVELRLCGCDQLTDFRPLANLTRLCTLTLPERGRHPIDWSALDRLTLLGAPTRVGGALGALGRVVEYASGGGPGDGDNGGDGDGDGDNGGDDGDGDKVGGDGDKVGNLGGDAKRDAPPFTRARPQRRWWPPSPTHHSHAHPLVSASRAFRVDCAWCRASNGDANDATADLGARCDRCDYELCGRCREKLRVKPRDPRWARDHKRRWRRRRPACATSLGLEPKVGGVVAATATADTASAAKNRALSELLLRPPALQSVAHLLPPPTIAWWQSMSWWL